MAQQDHDDGPVVTSVAAVLYLATRYALAPSGELAHAVERQLRLLLAHPAVQADPGARSLYARLLDEWGAAAGPGRPCAPSRPAAVLH